MADKALDHRVEDLEESEQQGSLTQRVERLERRWQVVWNDPNLLLRRAVELLNQRPEVMLLPLAGTIALSALQGN